MLFILVKAFQCRAPVALQVNSYHNITVFTGSLRLDDHIVLVADMIFDHRLTFDHKGIRALLLKLAANFNRLNRLGKYFEPVSGDNAAQKLTSIDIALDLQ